MWCELTHGAAQKGPDGSSSVLESPAWATGFRSLQDRVLSECEVHGTRKVVNYTIP